METERTYSNTLASKLKFRRVYHHQKKKGRIAMLVAVVLICIVSLVLEIVGLMKFQAVTDKTIPVVILIVAFVFGLSGASYSFSLADAAFHHRKCGDFEQLVLSSIAPAFISHEEVKVQPEGPQLSSIDRKIGLGAIITGVLEIVAVVIVAVVIIKLG